MSKQQREQFKIQLLELCSQALEAEIGIYVEVENPELFAPSFYQLRKAHEEFAHLSLMTSPKGPGHFWIVKGKTE
jgi:hypothetical protein